MRSLRRSVLAKARARAPLKQHNCGVRTNEVLQNERHHPCSRFQSNTHHILVGLLCSTDYVEGGRKQNEERRQLLYERSWPRINVIATNSTQLARWMCTTTTREGGHRLKREHSSINQATDDAASSSILSSTLEPTKMLAKHTQERTEELRERAQEMSDHGYDVAKMDDFREKPRETAVAGAKSARSALEVYGPVFLGASVIVNISMLASVFAGLEIGVLDPVTLFSWIGNAQEAGGEMTNTVDFLVEWMRNHEFTKNYADVVAKHPSVANLAIAWIATRFTKPIQFSLALAITPRLSRYLGFAPRDQQSDDVPNGTEKVTKEN